MRCKRTYWVWPQWAGGGNQCLKTQEWIVDLTAIIAAFEPSVPCDGGLDWKIELEDGFWCPGTR